ncbi:MAG: ABC transporter permease [Anaerolineales bacterium]|jgi:putative spermidine/putrescine transport system permease protein|uniref:ABC transporter permease n=1 Tax=Candidatus Villigracilis affinis TaxID=3140682 RepID=UPI001B3DFED3|nr:ABC transporter permease [Anaerolineales bacterium]MBL0348447.1 ABC transporter permease [Anaerolineales bacterium]MBP8047543.1 ABC transporter permease [Anaerolineales bacterium]
MLSKNTSQPSVERGSRWLQASAIAVLLFLHIPMWLIFLYSFTTDTAAYTFPPPGLTLKWIPQALSNPEMQAALSLSIRVASLATVAALILGTLAAAAVYRSDFFGKEAISFMLLLPLALPGIVTGIAMRSAMSLISIPFSYWTIVIGHATFCVVVVYNNVLARFRRSGGSMIEASMDLGANSFQTFWHIVLPNIGTALLAGAILAFSLSFDEVIVTTFTAGQQETLPIWILGQMFKPRSRPITNVTAMLVVIITALPILLAQRITAGSSDTEGSNK